MKGTLFVHEITTVKPGTATEYLDATREVRQPLMNEYGHRLVGLYEVLMHDYEVCTVWATDAADHVRMGKAFDVARGLLDAEARASPAIRGSSSGAGAHSSGPTSSEKN